MSNQIDIVALIEENPITKLSKDYNVKLLVKIKEQFTDFEQHLFLSSFYCYLNCDPINDFVIDLDDIWKWLGFSQKIKAKVLLEKQFIIDKDYTKSLYLQVKQSTHTKGGHNKETFLLNIETFKKFCLKAGTKKADEIHDYYMKLEKIIQNILQEECYEIKLQLEQKDKIIENQVIQTEKEKEKLKEDTLIEQFPLNTQCIYIGKIDNKTLGKPNSKMYHETVIKFGQSNNLAERVKRHKNTYENFRLHAAYKVKNKIEIENCIKKHPLLQKRIRLITTTDNITHRELLALDDDEFTLEKVEELIKEIIKENEYNMENYNLLIKKNDELQNEIYKLKEEMSEKDKIIKNSNNKIQKLEHDVTDEIKLKIANNYSICKYGYFLYAYQYENMRFICSITRQKDYDTLQKSLKDLYPAGEMKYFVKSSYPFTEKTMTFILKQNCVSLGQNKFETSPDNIKKIFDISVKLEELLIHQSKDLDTLSDIFSNNKITVENEEIDPEVPVVRKAKRSVDQINKDTGEIVATFESIEAAGRALGLTTGTAVGIALRESRVCGGFLWRYSGISKEEQFNEQPVIKICCSTGEKKFFKTIADAARDCNVSAPALRRRILTHVHINNHHWIFDKTANHYS
jgi:hypothetical protein